MDNLYAISDQDNKLILIKATDAISVVPVFRERIHAQEYINTAISETYRRDFTAVEFSLAMFDLSRSWADKSEIELFVHVYD